MRDQHSLRSHFARRFHQLENFHAAEVPGRQNHVMLRDQLDAAAHDVGDFAFRVDHGERRRSDSCGREFALNFRPEGQLGAGSVDAPGGFILRVDGREPNDLAAGAAGEFQRHRVQAAHRMIQCDGTVRGDSRHGFGDDFGALRGRKIMRLEDESLQAAARNSLARSRSSTRRSITSGATCTCKS